MDLTPSTLNPQHVATLWFTCGHWRNVVLLTHTPFFPACVMPCPVCGPREVARFVPWPRWKVAALVNGY